MSACEDGLARGYAYSGIVVARGNMVGGDAGVAVLMVCIKAASLLGTCWRSLNEACGRLLDESYMSCQRL